MTPTERRALELVMETVSMLADLEGYATLGYRIDQARIDLRREAERENVENGR